MESLGLDIRLFVAQLVNFLILFLVLSRFLYRPLQKLLDERKQKAQEIITKSQEIESRLARLEEEKKVVLETEKQRGRQEAIEIVSLASKKKEEIITEAKAAALREMDKNLKRINAAEQEVLRRLKTNLSEDLVDKVIKKLQQNSVKNGFPILKDLLK